MATSPVITGAPVRAPSIPSLARRSFLGALAFAPASAALSLTAISSPSATPFRLAEHRYRIALAHFEGLPGDLEDADRAAYERAEDAFHEAWDAVEAAPIADWSEFVVAFAIACDNGNFAVNEDRAAELLIAARRLAGKA